MMILGRMPSWKCHKVVKADKLIEVDVDTEGQGVRMRTAEATIEMPQEWFDRFRPEVGSYFVLYADGYASMSPARAFEDGYTPIIA